MKQWEKLELRQLEVSLTKEEMCYCDQGEVERHGHHGCGGHHGGHHHKPGKPCPDKPQKPNKPQCNIPACPGFGPNGPVTPGLDATPVPGQS